MNQNISYEDIYEMCKQHMHSYVLVETTDGVKTDGIITGLDEENVYLAVPMSQNSPAAPGDPNVNPNQFGRYPFPGYGPGFGFYPPRRFRRLVIPLTFLAALSLLPWY
ncbi:hypothetical protein SPD48_04335 [Pseudogracilibacillus sp. SE30717A]|uniref:hypothetical protein n=1 Tax=Pseudogracilibacillus sp. SE30717A TaxID=3098293 RepID=UPI00300E063A